MHRRTFLSAAGAATLGAATAALPIGAARAATPSGKGFSLKYAPHLGLNSTTDGMFRHHGGSDPVGQVAFMAEAGFTAIEDNFMKIRDVATQTRIGREIQRHGMEMGVVVNTMVYDRPTFVLDDKTERARLVQEVRDTAEVAKRVGSTYVTTLSGTAHSSIPRDIQTRNMIENLKWAGEEAARQGIILAVEPINVKGWPATFVTNVPHGFMIVDAVDMPSVSLIYDFYHQQIDGGDLLDKLDLVESRMGYVQVADNPGRVEPGVGETNYGNVFKALKGKGFEGIVEL